MNLINVKNLKKIKRKPNKPNNCSVNQASNEIMLQRISVGKEIEFPFSSLNKE